MRPGAAAHAEIADVYRQRLATEIGDLKAVAGKRGERYREWPAAPVAVPVRIAQRLERRLAGGRAIRDGQGGQGRLRARADLLQERQPRLRATGGGQPG